MALAIAESNGIKRICTNCGTRYYDMGKTPITCPSCDTEFIGQVKPKAVESLDAKEKEKEEEPVVDITAGAKKEDGEEEVISLDEVEASLDEDDDGADDEMSLDDSDLDLDVVAPKGDDE